MAEINPKRSPFLPQELVEKILSKLPVKALLKFRCVSKPWRSIIDSKRFVKTHFRSSTQMRLIINNHDEVLKQSDDFLFYDSINKFLKWPRIIGCCNGLVCIFELSDRSFIFWNPSTRRFKKLPQVYHASRNCKWRVIERHLSWDESSDDYLVIACLWLVDKLIHREYSSKTDSWKTTGTSDLIFKDGEVTASHMEDKGIHVGSRPLEMEDFPREFGLFESLVSPHY